MKTDQTIRVTIELTDVEFKALFALADAKEMSVNSVMRQALAQYQQRYFEEVGGATFNELFLYKTMETKLPANLNTPAVRRVLQNMIWQHVTEKPKLSDIAIKENSHLFYKGKPIFRGDRHCHYCGEENHLLGIFEWLKSAEDSMKWSAVNGFDFVT